MMIYILVFLIGISFPLNAMPFRERTTKLAPQGDNIPRSLDRSIADPIERSEIMGSNESLLRANALSEEFEEADPEYVERTLNQFIKFTKTQLTIQSINVLDPLSDHPIWTCNRENHGESSTGIGEKILILNDGKKPIPVSARDVDGGMTASEILNIIPAGIKSNVKVGDVFETYTAPSRIPTPEENQQVRRFIKTALIYQRLPEGEEALEKLKHKVKELKCQIQGDDQNRELKRELTFVEMEYEAYKESFLESQHLIEALDQPDVISLPLKARDLINILSQMPRNDDEDRGNPFELETSKNMSALHAILGKNYMISQKHLTEMTRIFRNINSCEENQSLYEKTRMLFQQPEEMQSIDRGVYFKIALWHAGNTIRSSIGIIIGSGSGLIMGSIVAPFLPIVAYVTKSNIRNHVDKLSFTFGFCNGIFAMILSKSVSVGVGIGGLTLLGTYGAFYVTAAVPMMIIAPYLFARLVGVEAFNHFRPDNDYEIMKLALKKVWYGNNYFYYKRIEKGLSIISSLKEEQKKYQQALEELKVFSEKVETSEVAHQSEESSILRPLGFFEKELAQYQALGEEQSRLRIAKIQEILTQLSGKLISQTQALEKYQKIESQIMPANSESVLTDVTPREKEFSSEKLKSLIIKWCMSLEGSIRKQKSMIEQLEVTAKEKMALIRPMLFCF